MCCGSIGAGSPLLRFVLPRGGADAHALHWQGEWLRCAKLEFPVSSLECCFHILLRYNEGNVRPRRTLRNGDDVDVFPAQRSERTADRSATAQVPAHDRNDGHGLVKSDVLDFFVGEVLLKLAAQSLDRALRSGRSNHQTNVILRRGL